MAERFSRFRDAGTGIQVFLPPVPPVGSASPLSLALLPVGLVLGVLRITLLCVLVTLWPLLFMTIGALGSGARTFTHVLMGRGVLLVVGFIWINKELVSIRNRGRATNPSNTTSFAPKKGDVILCNWSSWVDVLVLLITFNPTFVRPIISARQSKEQSTGQSSASDRRRRQGAAARGQQHHDVDQHSVAKSSPTCEERLKGWKACTFVDMIVEAGLAPATEKINGCKSLEDVIKQASGPVIVFPEIVTSNNRGLLQFEAIFPHSWRSLFRATGALRIGKGQSEIFIMSIKHDPPTATSPSTTLSVPSSSLSPIPHLLRLCFAPALYALTVRLLSPDESPTHSAFVVDAVAAQRTDGLADKCADLMSSISRLRRTGLGWQDKEDFLTMYLKRR